MENKLNKRPWIMRLPFLTMRERLYYRHYGIRADKFPELYSDASLALAPKVHLGLIPTDVSHRWIALTGFYELPLTWVIGKLARKGGLLVDAGANFGYYSCLWAGINPANRAIAFEPSPKCIPGLKSNIKRNNFQDRVQIKEIALGKENGVSKFFLGPAEQSGWGGLVINNSQAEAEVSEVKVGRLDDIYNEISKAGIIDLLKVDVEGADTWVLQGAEKLLKEKRIKRIFLEENLGRMEPLGIAKSQAPDFLRSLGYRVSYFSDKILEAIPLN